MNERLIEISDGPKCPKCGNDGFDDWWHDKTCRSGGGVVVELYAELGCHECGAVFEVTKYVGGETHSTIPPVPTDNEPPASFRRIYEKMQRGKVSADDRTESEAGQKGRPSGGMCK